MYFKFSLKFFEIVTGSYEIYSKTYLSKFIINQFIIIFFFKLMINIKDINIVLKNYNIYLRFKIIIHFYVKYYRDFYEINIINFIFSKNIISHFQLKFIFLYHHSTLNKI